ncbi:MAG: eukaryotic-like serine/threonine-protein kinase [Acidobacteriota bacterium]|jgi:serine/threonine protein kinase/Tol biopolymer transport system component|nr:eukaryotic-like serine/threonine-protein kinase [Acidobacteriota bacterium]
MSIATGTNLGRYEIRSHIGAGGMGEVYLAKDTSLDRVVALKILPPEIASDQQRMQRFVQEAKSASSLNHPNILTIFEIGETDGSYFIATEFIDGVTLRQHMASRRVKLSEALDIAAQIAAALTAAHAVGIIHRDIKPENIMLRKDGYAKLLDFGLAKPTERQVSLVDTEAQTQMLVNTSPGMVMGTVSYMSPEQARGYALDGRTDIWSLGCVLYEMVAGRVPFSGETTSDVIVAVLDREPPPLSGGPHEAPLELQRILRKALRKDKEERYQTVKDLLVDLRALKQEVDFEAKLETSVPPESRSLAAFSTIASQNSLESERERSAHTSHVPAARSTLASAQPASRIKQGDRFKQWAMLALVAAFAAGITGLVYMYLHQRAQRAASAPQQIKITRLTTTGKIAGAAISPDGKIVAYIANEAGQRSLWVRQVATSRNLQIVEPSEVDYWGLSLSPDGNYAYYNIAKPNNPLKELYQVSVLGGTPKKIMSDVDTPVTFSPDGKQFAFMRGEPTKSEYALFIANADGTGERRLASRKSPQFYESPAWSPDGKSIAVSAGDTSAGKEMTVVEVSVEDGTEKPITSEKWVGVGQIAWLADGSGLVINAADQDSRLQQLWHLSYPEGTSRRLTNDLNQYTGVSVASETGDVVTVRFDQSTNIWVTPGITGAQSRAANGVPAIDTSKARQLTSGAVKYYGGTWTPDGKIVYVSDASGNRDLWIMDADGSNQKQLTFDAGTNLGPVVSPDGRYVVFVSDRKNSKPTIWRMEIDGSNAKQLTSGNYDRNPAFSPDGQWVIYASMGVSHPNLWRVSINGGEAVKLNDKFSVSPSVSPDGKFIACYYWDEKPDTQLVSALIPFEGGQPVKTFNLPSATVRWTLDGSALTYVDSRGGVSNIWSQPADGGKPVQLTDFKSDQIFAFEWSRDGKQLACARGIMTSDVVLFNNLK